MSSEQLYFSEGQLFPIFTGGAPTDPLVCNNLSVNTLANINDLKLDAIPNVSTSDLLFYNQTTKQVSYAVMPPQPLPTNLTVDNLDVNTLATINDLKLDSIPNSSTANGLYYNTTTKQVSYAPASTPVIPDPLVLNNLDVNVLATINDLKLDNVPNTRTNNFVFLDTTTKQVSQSAVNDLILTDLVVTNETTVDLLYVNNTISGLSGGELTVDSDIKVNGLMTLNNIPNSVKSDVLYYDTVAKQVSYGTISSSVKSVLFYNRLTAIALTATAINTATQINITAGTLGTDYVGLKLVNFTLINNAIRYTGSTLKNFYVQVSYALLQGANSGTTAFELRKNGVAVSQARWGTIAAGSNYDIQDFNYVDLNTNDELTFWFASSTLTNNLGASSQNGLSGSTTKPLQIFIQEI